MPSLLVALALAVSPARGGILEVSGPAVHDTTTDLSEIRFATDVYQNTSVVGFDEAQDVLVAAGEVCVDQIVTDADVGRTFVGSPPDGSSDCRPLPAGRYSSHILHFDTFGSGGIGGASFRFDGEVVGFAFATVGLLSTDASFGTAAAYPGPGWRWVEDDDTFTLVASDTVVTGWWWHSYLYYDELRVITRSALPVSVDQDGDGIDDDVDLCPAVADPDQVDRDPACQ